MRVFIYSYGVPTERYPLNGIFAFDHAKAIKNRGVEVFFLYTDLRSIRRFRKFGLNVKLIDGVSTVGISLPIGRVPSIFLNMLDEFIFKNLYKIAVKKFGIPNIIHSHFMRQSMSVVKNKNLFNNSKILSTIHDGHLMNGISISDNKIISLISRNAHRIYVVSIRLREILEQINIKSEIISNIIDDSFYYSKDYSKQQPEFIISAANLSHNKGMDILINSWNVSNLKNTYKLLIMGDGPEKYKLKKQISFLNLDESVILYGKYSRNEFASYLNKCVVFVLASRSESFGLVYAEALGKGVPIVGTFCGGPEAIVNDSNGILVPVDDFESLAKAMDKVVENINSYNPEIISKNITDKHSSSSVANKLIFDYNLLLQESKS